MAWDGFSSLRLQILGGRSGVACFFLGSACQCQRAREFTLHDPHAMHDFVHIYYSAVRALPAEIANSISAIYLRKIGGNTNLILNSD